MYVRFPLSRRNVEDLLFERGIDICHETVRLWWNRSGPLLVADIRRQRVSRMRDKKAALAIIKKALKRHGKAETITTDRLRSYGATLDELGNRDKPEIGRWANNRMESSHLPFRRRERAMLRFRQMKSLQKFASVHASIRNHFNLDRHLVDRKTYKQSRSVAPAECQSLAA